ncbi:helix-turn-helix domain-containing protein [Actinosynnema sp. NPDC053489]|uniref:helix-turn-helix domain-containing protein n=1 Tax=Actinosynnema sp. NPDC053489 TaxID=3363916 RepID=UPI0037CC7B6C
MVHQRRLRSELRRLRDDAGLTQKDAAEQLDWSVSKVIRIENGTTNVGITDLRALLLLYGVHDQDKVDALVAEARASRKRAWWKEYRSLVEPQFYSFIGYEASAVRIFQYQSLTMPGLLQTADYTRVLTGAFGYDEEAVDLGVKIRSQRQGIVGPGGPDLVFILDEAVLRRRVGSVDVMRGQYQRLIDAAKLPNVSVRVLPFDVAGGHLGLKGSFSILDLGEGDDGKILILEEPLRDVLVRDNGSEVDKYSNAFDMLLDVATPKDQTIEFVEQLQDELK